MTRRALAALACAALAIPTARAAEGQQAAGVPPTPAVPATRDGGAGGAFRRSLERHMAAVSGRDLATLETTLTRTEALTLIFPDGSTLDTRAAFVDFHRTWFADRKWTWRGEILRTIETPSLATALVRYAYDPDGAAGEQPARESWLALTFAEEAGAWRLVLDQNTRIEPSAP